MQMWERVVSAGCAPWAGCWAAEPPSPLQNKPLPQPQESGTWGTGPAGHELLQSCWCPSLWDRGSLRATVSTWIFKKKKSNFFFPFPSCFFSTHTWRGRMQAHACCIFPSRKPFLCVCFYLFCFGFFFPYTFMEQYMISVCCSKKKKGVFLFLFPIC